MCIKIFLGFICACWLVGRKNKEKKDWEKVEACWRFSKTIRQGTSLGINSSLTLDVLSTQALRDSGIKIDIEIEADVTNLKSSWTLCMNKHNVFPFYYSEFFEDCVAEATYEAQKIDIMRDAVKARISYERARENSVTDQNGINN